MNENSKSVKVKNAQSISRMCFICGEENILGLHCRFFTLADGRVACQFTAREEHQGYPGRMHGGVISAVMDELIGRLVQVDDPEAFAVTIDLNVKFRKPVPLGEELVAVSWLTNRKTRLLEGQAELCLSDGSVAVQASGKYIQLGVKRIAPEGMDESVWYDDTQPVPEFIQIAATEQQSLE